MILDAWWCLLPVKSFDLERKEDLCGQVALQIRATL